MRFYTGTVDPGWLADPAFEGVPLFVSRNRLAGHVEGVRAQTRWALDSGAFTQLALHGTWAIPARQYAREAKRFQTAIGRMDWAAVQDWSNPSRMYRKRTFSGETKLRAV